MIEIKHLSKTFGVSGGTVDALKDITLTKNKVEILSGLDYHLKTHYV